MTTLRRLILVLSLLVKHFFARRLGRYNFNFLPHEAFVSDFEKLFASADALGDSQIKAFHFVNLRSDRVPWVDTGIDLSPGEEVTSFTMGRVYLSQALNLWSGPAFQFWYRLGEKGKVQRGPRATHTFKAPDKQRLYVAGLNPGSWSDDQGGLAVPESVYKKGLGRVSLALVVWKGDAPTGLSQLTRAKDWEHVGSDVRSLVLAEIERQRQSVSIPEGWQYLWELGPGEIYQLDDSDGLPCMRCHTREDVGILRKEVSFDLRPETRLSWDWKVDELPSVYAEDTVPTHDYLSIALEFENGRDLTYYWSAKLPVETSYHCPLPNWQHRETHMVIRSGEKQLRQWLSEERFVYDDYAKAIGEPPSKIVRVWFIAVSIFQHRQGKCEYRQVKLKDDKAVLDIL